MRWRDFKKTITVEFMEKMELIISSQPPLISFIPSMMEPEKDGGAPALPVAVDSHPSTNWRPEFKAWLTKTGELRTQGMCDDLAAEIINLTQDNLPLQAKLLRLHVGSYSGLHWQAMVEQWEERVAIKIYEGGMSRESAEFEAARFYRMEAFLDELRKINCTALYKRQIKECKRNEF